MTWAWNVSDVTRAQRLVLLALGDFSNDDGVSWPSIDSIGHKALLQPRRLQIVLRQLETHRLVRVEFGSGQHGTNRYTLMMSENAGVHKMRGALLRPENAPNPSGTNKDFAAAANTRAEKAVEAFRESWNTEIKQFLSGSILDAFERMAEESEALLPAWGPEAIKRAVAQGNPRWSYIRGILEPWITAGRMDDCQRSKQPYQTPEQRRRANPLGLSESDLQQNRLRMLREGIVE